MVNIRVLVLVMFSCILSLVGAHSWVHCADYTEENGRKY